MREYATRPACRRDMLVLMRIVCVVLDLCTGPVCQISPTSLRGALCVPAGTKHLSMNRLVRSDNGAGHHGRRAGRKKIRDMFHHRGLVWPLKRRSFPTRCPAVQHSAAAQRASFSNFLYLIFIDFSRTLKFWNLATPRSFERFGIEGYSGRQFISTFSEPASRSAWLAVDTRNCFSESGETQKGIAQHHLHSSLLAVSWLERPAIAHSRPLFGENTHSSELRNGQLPFLYVAEFRAQP